MEDLRNSACCQVVTNSRELNLNEILFRTSTSHPKLGIGCYDPFASQHTRTRTPMTQKLRALYQQLPTNYSALSTAWLTTFSCILTMLESYCASYPGMLAEVVSASPDPISETDDLLAYTQAMQPYQVAKHALHAEMKHRYNSTTDSAQRTLLILAMHHSKENSFSCACDDEEYEWLVGETDL